MKLKEALIVWTPVGWLDRLGRQAVPSDIRVGYFKPGAQEWSAQYKCSWGACNADVRKFTKKQATAEVMHAFNSMVMESEMSPADVHREFCKIDEYREATTAGCPER